MAQFSLASLLGVVAALTEVGASGWIVQGIAAGGILCLTYASFQLILESLLTIDIIDEHRRMLDEDRTAPLEKVCYIFSLMIAFREYAARGLLSFEAILCLFPLLPLTNSTEGFAHETYAKVAGHPPGQPDRAAPACLRLCLFLQ
ncbi:MAG: hypothetical protein ACE5G0_10530 [Rhodothermales bacterium]